MPQLAFANSFWQSYDVLEKPIKAGVRKAMDKFQQLSIAELRADKGLHLESVTNARDPRMRTIRINDFWRGVVLAPDDGSDTFLLLNVVSHDDAYDWAAKRLYTVNTATRALEVRNVAAIEQLTPALEKAAAEAPSLLFARYSDTVLRHLGIDDQVLRAVRTIIDKRQLDAFGTLLPEDQFEVLQYLAEGFTPDEVYRDVVAERRPADATPEPSESLALAIANTANRITLVTRPDELAEILDKPFAAWRVFLHPSQRRVAYRVSYNGPAQVTGGPGTGKTVVALHRVKHLLSRTPNSRVLLTTYTNALASTLRERLALLLDDEEQLARVEVTTVNAVAHRTVRPSPGGCQPRSATWTSGRSGGGCAGLKLPWTEQFLAQEFRHVILAHNVQSRRSTARPAGGEGVGARTAPARPGVGRRGHVPEGVVRSGHCHAPADLRPGGAAARRRQPLRPRVRARRGRRGAGPASRAVAGAAGRGDARPGRPLITGDPHQRIYDSRSRWARSVSPSPVAAAGCGSTTAAPRRSSPGQPGCWSGRGSRISAATVTTASPVTDRCSTASGPTPRGTRRARPRSRRSWSGWGSGWSRASRRARSRCAPGSTPLWATCRRRWLPPGCRLCGCGTSLARRSTGAAGHHARDEGVGVPVCGGGWRYGAVGAVCQGGHAGRGGSDAARERPAPGAVPAVRCEHAGTGGAARVLERSPARSWRSPLAVSPDDP
ncbi:UvrD-helicase domain-containing protein [Micromonospora sp. BRA006-A]|nr:UvrD-helicase domain-containing protein [Micromonospora sp. BRA006-A]